MKASERIGLLMYRYMRNELSPREMTELWAWRNKSPKHETAFQEATDWDNALAELRWSYSHRDAILEKIKEKYPALWQPAIEKPRKKVRLIYRIMRAAIYICCLYLFLDYRYAVYEHRNPVPGTFNGSITGSSDDFAIPIIHQMIRGYKAGSAGLLDNENENGEKEYLAVSDARFPELVFDLPTFRGNTYVIRLRRMGSIWVNSSSTIWYLAKFKGDTLRVKLTGEAYFEMEPNKGVVIEIPSTVNHQPSTFIRESGSFNVHAYPSDSLKVGRDEQSVAWKNKMIYYKDASLKTILDEISRWYNVDVEYKGSSQDGKYNIRLPRNAAFSEVIRVLKEQGAKIFVNRNHIYVL